MSEQSFDPAFDDTRASGRGAPPRVGVACGGAGGRGACSRVVLVLTIRSAGRGLALRSRASSASGSTRRRAAAACRKAAVVRELISRAFGGHVKSPGPGSGAVTVDGFGGPVDPLRPAPTVVAEPVVPSRDFGPASPAPSARGRGSRAAVAASRSPAGRRRRSRHGAWPARRERSCSSCGRRPEVVGLCSFVGCGRRAGASDVRSEAFG